MFGSSSSRVQKMSQRSRQVNEFGSENTRKKDKKRFRSERNQKHSLVA